MSARYDIPTKGKSKESPEEVITKLNSGIAIVTPAGNIREWLMDEEVLEDRLRQSRKIKQDRPAATADFANIEDNKQMTGAASPRDRIKIPIPTRDQFMSDLTKATRKRKK